jgi:hypothetical protein
MFYDDNWMGNLNYVVNNLEGTLPFTPQFELKLSGSYKIPRVEVDLGVRYRMHSGRAMWLQEDYPLHTEFAAPPGGVIIPGGLPQIVGVDPTDPDYLPNQQLFDLHVERAFNFGRNPGNVKVVLDGFNIFNTSAPLNMDVHFDYGRVAAIPIARRFRFGLRYEF